MTDAITTTTEQRKRRRRPYISKNAQPVQVDPRLTKARALVSAPGTPGEGAAALAAVERLLAKQGIVRNRLDWAAVPEHVADFPDHIGLCNHCGERFDRVVNPATGEHHTYRGSDYCSDTCQNSAKKDRAKGRTAFKARHEPGPYASALPMADVRAVLNKVRVELVTGYGVHVSPLYQREWALLAAGAPAVADGLRFFDSLSEARQRGNVGMTSNERQRVEALRTELVAVIDGWFITHS